jgi:hypothetical protein
VHPCLDLVASKRSTPIKKGNNIIRKTPGTLIADFGALIDSVHVSIEERVSMVANQEGELEQLEVKGVLTLKISDPAMGRIRLSLDAADDASIQFKVTKATLFNPSYQLIFFLFFCRPILMSTRTYSRTKRPSRCVILVEHSL